ncbi:hypothetical protein OPV22_021715 [Ensete ventricosum]|uniref:Ubiquitin-like domain-containing protein n=1 Tax=Ensete ventricosum TaxID=4639 RepID=A0AAV8QSU6_ENSVE|nr:hypothetical protein OPV22_021715 [Ensete ventricosum]
MAVEDLIELKFRLFDGTDIGPNKYDPSTTVASLKEAILARWPQGTEIAPKTINDVKLINAGKILENNWTITDAASHDERPLAKDPKTNRCACTIL